jgi:hypothetical protein
MTSIILGWLVFTAAPFRLDWQASHLSPLRGRRMQPAYFRSNLVIVRRRPIPLGVIVKHNYLFDALQGKTIVNTEARTVGPACPKVAWACKMIRTLLELIGKFVQSREIGDISRERLQVQ